VANFFLERHEVAKVLEQRVDTLKLDISVLEGTIVLKDSLLTVESKKTAVLDSMYVNKASELETYKEVTTAEVVKLKRHRKWLVGLATVLLLLAAVK